MYLSRLFVNAGTDPDRPRPGRDWLKNVYRVHHRLCMAFPSDKRISRDNPFLAPFDEKDFDLIGRKRSQDGKRDLTRAEKNSFLFRIETSHPPVILVQSYGERPPNWDYAFQNAPYLLLRKPDVIGTEQCAKYLDTVLSSPEIRFRLRANPTRKARVSRRDGSDIKSAGKGHGKRTVLRTMDEQIEWLRDKGQVRTLDGKQVGGGFDLDPQQFQLSPEQSRIIGEGWVTAWKGKEEDQGKRCLKFRSVLFEGVLKVTDPELFLKALRAGIGPGKAFGFGLLSVARV
jgi:CRISPR system Cascade subunit CasE